jgi:hypothetical protein
LIINLRGSVYIVLNALLHLSRTREDAQEACLEA